MKKVLRNTAIGAAILIGSSAAWAQQGSGTYTGKWEPMSRSALAVTGPIELVDGKLYMDGVHRFNYTPTISGYALVSTKEVNPALLNGNSLCAKDSAPTRMTLAANRDGAGDTLQMDVYATSPDKPPFLCGQYHYIRAQ